MWIPSNNSALTFERDEMTDKKKFKPIHKPMELGDRLSCVACMGEGEHPMRIKCFVFKVIAVKCSNCEGRGYSTVDQITMDFNKTLDDALEVWDHKKAKADKAHLN